MPLPTVAADADEATEGERVILVAVLAGCSESLSDDVTPKLYLLLLKKISKSRCLFAHFSDPPPLYHAEIDQKADIYAYTIAAKNFPH